MVSINPIDKEKDSPEFLFYQLKGKYKQIRNITGDNQRSGLNIPIINNFEVIIILINIQQVVINRVYEEYFVVDNNVKLIHNYSEKIIMTIN